MNVVIYARFSSHSQTEQSIEGQLKECYAYAQRNDYTVVGEYVDRALSGTTDHRPEFQRMIADSAKKTFQGVLVYQLDRFARNRYDSATYKSKLKKNGVRVLSARENISDDASGVLMEAVLEGMAEYYSVELAQKIKRGMDINAEKCLSTGGNLALGFKTEGKRIVVDPLTAPIVVKIFEMYVTGSTMADIIRDLNANQVKTSYGNEFNKNSINRILRNKRYIGVYTYRDKEIPDGLPRIVDEDLFWEAQRIMEKNKKAPARAKAKVDYLLTTKLFCGYCKAAMTGISGTSKTERKYHYYQCVTNRRDKSCDKKTVGKEYIEDLVVNRLRDFLTPDNISTIAKEVVDLCERESNNGNARRLQKLIVENEKATENLLKALESGQAVDIIADRITQKKKEHDELSLQLLLENSQHPTPSVKEIRFFLNQFRKGDINDPKYRQGLVDMLVNKIYLYDGKMTVLCNTQDGHFDVDLKEVSSLKGQLVEVGGVEPPSESTSTGLSPGADGYCGSLPSRSPSRRQAVTPPGQVRVMMHGRVNSFPPHGRHINDAFPGLWPLRFRRPPLIRQRQQLVCCCLIYKLPIFRMLGASARLSRLHTPVETGTPPRRYKLRSTRFRLRRKLAPLRLSLLFPS